MRKLVQRLYDFFIPDSSRKDEHEFRKARIFVNTSLITGCFAVFYILQTSVFGQPHILRLMIVWAILFYSLPFFLKWGVPLRLCANLFVAITFLSGVWEIYWTGGLKSAVLPWMSMVAVTSILLSKPKDAWIWFAIALVWTNLVFVLSRNNSFPIEMNMKFYDYSILAAYVGLVTIMFVISLVMENAYIRSLKILAEKNKAIEEERKRSDELLRNILPEEVMEELKQTGKTTARNYDLVTVMFVDFKDFTLISSDLTPEDLVSSIDLYFETFDKIVTDHDIEKIKTVGDAYLCAAGLPVPNTKNPVEMVDVAFKFLYEVERLKEKRIAENKTMFDVRIGIHSGPLIAGVVGTKKFAYDIWGDAVNTAARMQQNGEQGKINISGTTYELIKHRFHCTHRGRIEAKNKGLVDMYFVEGRR